MSLAGIKYREEEHFLSAVLMIDNLVYEINGWLTGKQEKIYTYKFIKCMGETQEKSEDPKAH